ncbi:threonylcarbamoyladenosine tRNA methylthiotransferase [Candidatus Bathyarchaeota archaeon ex4484_135]|nr:MAG: threonylcarbamoyladenosine tRNA methylthiotransferase [Candidatus Bathyarchaeota archaeon ex4484_135]
MRVYIESYGCAMNMADGHLMAELLAEAGHTIVDRPEEADVIILNTCTVRSDTERRMVRRLRELMSYGRRLVVAGCLASAQPGLVYKISRDISLLSARAVEAVREVVEANGPVYVLEPRPRERLPKLLHGISITIPIAEGCLGSCAYCIVRVARGPLRSYRPEAIVRAVEEAVRRGAREVRLTAQDTGVYGLDMGTNLAELLRAVCEVEGLFMVRVGMMNPNAALRILDDLVEAYKDPKVYKFLHLPVQTGDDRLLKAMRRNYTVEDFLTVVDAFRREFPDLMLATDIMVGLPGEDEEAFRNTLELLKRVRPDKVHVARFTPRPHTKAASMPGQIPEPEKKRRSRIVTALVLKIGLEKNRALIGRRLACLVVGRSGREGQLEARAMNYKPVYFTGPEVLVGDFLGLEIIDAGPYYLIGRAYY